MELRAATPDDVPAIAGIYAWHVLHGTGTFETEPPDEAEVARRLAEVQGSGLPWLVAIRDGRVVGYAYANWFRPRLAYRWCYEDSIYVAHDAVGGGIGRALLTALLDASVTAGGRQMVAVIGDSENHGSIGLHRALGFADAGVMRAAGFKLGRWLDVVILQRALGEGDATPPA